MGIIITWIVCSFIVAFVFGVARTIGFWSSFFVCLILSPLIGFIITLCYKTIEEDKRQKDMLKAMQQKNAMVSGASKADELIKWKSLLDSGTITKEQYEAEKQKLLF